ncbi:molybdopterin-guanine dinucleotide biosynthesis protein MobB [Thermaerobacter litoralis]
MISLEEAFATLLEAAAPLGTERVPVVRAAGRIAAEPVVAPGPVPVAPRVMMDGYACRAVDLAGARAERPVHLRLTGWRWAGGSAGAGSDGPDPGPRAAGPDSQGDAVGAGEAWQVATGALLPPGADVVVPVEGARRQGDGIQVAVPLPPGRHVAPPGEDVVAGQVLVEAGQRIGPRIAGLLAAAGVGWVTVWRRPRVLLVATGDELVPAGRWSPARHPAAVPNSNLLVLAAALEELGLLVEAGGILPDDPAALEAGLRRAAASGADVVLTTGGVSVGPRDRVARTWLRLGARRLLGRIDVKPGGPFFAGRLGRQWLVGLPGSPAACLAVFEVLVRPFLLRLAGRRAIARPVVPARLAAPWPKGGGRARLLWAHLDRQAGTVEPRVPAAGRLVAIGHSNALLYGRPGEPVPAPGSLVGVLDLEAPDDRPWLAWFDARSPTGPAGPRRPPIVAVTGRSGSGKTQAAAGLVALLAARGHRVLAVKHTAHGFQLDRPESDSQRLGEAGAAAVGLVGPGEVALRHLDPGTSPGHPPEDEEAAGPGWTAWVERLADAAACLGPPPDLVLVEGGAGSGWPEIVVGEPKAAPRGEVIDRLPPGFDRRRLAVTAAALEEWLRRAKTGCDGKEGLGWRPS